MKSIVLAVLAGVATLAMTWAVATVAWAGPDEAVKLFKIVSVRDEIVVGLTPAQQGQLDGRDAAGLARALKERGSVEVWRYAVAKGPDGELRNAPTALVSILAHDTVRVEPYASPLPVASPSDRPRP